MPGNHNRADTTRLVLICDLNTVMELNFVGRLNNTKEDRFCKTYSTTYLPNGNFSKFFL